MIRLFNVYYPVRTLVLLLGEALVVGFSFLLGTMFTVESMLRLSNTLFIERGYLRILALTAVVLLLSHGFDLYDSSKIEQKLDQAFRILFVLGLVALILGAILYKFPDFLPGNNSAVFGVVILAVSLFCWRSAYGWIHRPCSPVQMQAASTLHPSWARPNRSQWQTGFAGLKWHRHTGPPLPQPSFLRSWPSCRSACFFSTVPTVFISGWRVYFCSLPPTAVWV